MTQVLRKLREEDHKFKACLDYTVSSGQLRQLSEVSNFKAKKKRGLEIYLSGRALADMHEKHAHTAPLAINYKENTIQK